MLRAFSGRLRFRLEAGWLFAGQSLCVCVCKVNNYSYKVNYSHGGGAECVIELGWVGLDWVACLRTVTGKVALVISQLRGCQLRGELAKFDPSTLPSRFTYAIGDANLSAPTGG